MFSLSGLLFSKKKKQYQVYLPTTGVVLGFDVSGVGSFISETIYIPTTVVVLGFDVFDVGSFFFCSQAGGGALGRRRGPKLPDRVHREEAGQGFLGRGFQFHLKASARGVGAGGHGGGEVEWGREWGRDGVG